MKLARDCSSSVEKLVLWGGKNIRESIGRGGGGRGEDGVFSLA